MVKGQNMKDLLKSISKRPEVFELSIKNIWNDVYISKNMLKSHLNTYNDAATRKLNFVKQSVYWIADILPSSKYPKILDLGCGPGIYAELFQEKGYEVTGIDISKNSIEYAKLSAHKKQLQIDYKQGNYMTMDFHNYYNVITLIYCDFGVLCNDDRVCLLKKIYDALLPNGVFLFDVFTPVKYVGVEETKHWEVEKHGFWSENLYLLLHAFYRYDECNTFLNQYYVIESTEVSQYHVWEHTFLCEELEHDVKRAGFAKVAFYGDVTGKEYDKNGETICIIARK